jgi:hypothetical protein
MVHQHIHPLNQSTISFIQLLTLSRFPASRVMLSMDPAQMPFLNELTTFAVENWGYLPPNEQSLFPLQKAASAMTSCISMANQAAPTCSDEVVGIVDDVIKSSIEAMMTRAETTLMQSLAPAHSVKVGPAITAYLNQLHVVQTLHLPNSIPHDVDSVFGNISGKRKHREPLTLCLVSRSHPNFHTCLPSYCSSYQPHRPQR